MTEQEQINSELRTRLALHDEKFNSLIQSLEDFKNEMRQQNEMRANEVAEIRNDIKEINKSTDAKIEAIRQSVASIQENGRNQTIVTFLGIAAMVVAVLLK